MGKTFTPDYTMLQYTHEGNGIYNCSTVPNKLPKFWQSIVIERVRRGDIKNKAQTCLRSNENVRRGFKIFSGLKSVSSNPNLFVSNVISNDTGKRSLLIVETNSTRDNVVIYYFNAFDKENSKMRESFAKSFMYQIDRGNY